MQDRVSRAVPRLPLEVQGDELARLPGVGDVLVWGAGEYSMRVWRDLSKVATRWLTASDVVAAVREQSVQVTAGSAGQQPDTSAPSR